MKRDFRDLRLRQLARSLSAFEPATKEPRPQRGWLRAIREGLGLSLEDVGKRVNQSRRRIQEFEKAEAEDRITLQSLRRVAAAMECELVYAVVPKSGTISELAERRARAQATEDVLDVRADDGSRKPSHGKRRRIDRGRNKTPTQEAMSTIPNLNDTPGNTPLHPDDAAQLIPNLASRRELDEWERRNILVAQIWALNSRIISRRDPLDEI